jgi:hypothetical protein
MFSVSKGTGKGPPHGCARVGRPRRILRAFCSGGGPDLSLNGCLDPATRNGRPTLGGAGGRKCALKRRSRLRHQPQPRDTVRPARAGSNSGVAVAAFFTTKYNERDAICRGSHSLTESNARPARRDDLLAQSRASMLLPSRSEASVQPTLPSAPKFR